MSGRWAGIVGGCEFFFPFVSFRWFLGFLGGFGLVQGLLLLVVEEARGSRGVDVMGVTDLRRVGVYRFMAASKVLGEETVGGGGGGEGGGSGSGRGVETEQRQGLVQGQERRDL